MYHFNFPLEKDVFISPLKEKDNKDLYNKIISNKAYLYAWCPWMHNLKTIDDVTSYLRGYVFLNSNNLYWSIGIYKKKQLIGWVSVFNFNWAQKSCYLGYWIDEKNQGKGYIRRTLKFLISLMTHLFNIKHFYALCHKENHASQKVVESLKGKKIDGQNLEDFLFIYKITPTII